MTNERGIFSRNGETYMKYKHNIFKIYNIEILEESVVFRLY